jgi:copper chaperone CopZ
MEIIQSSILLPHPDGNGQREAHMVKKTFQVEGMSCSSCPMKLESIEDDLPGIKQVSASYQKGNMVVEFDETKVSEAQIMAAAAKLGYQAFPV